VLSDNDIAAMTPDQRRDLIRRLARPADEILPPRRVLRRVRDFRIALMVGSVVVLVPWIVYLGITLPRLYVAHNWDKTWVGFDVLLLVMLVATGVLGYLRRQMLSLTAFATGILLLCDAWFDVMTSHGSEVPLSFAMAMLVELPLAVVLIFGGLQVMRVSAARLWHLEGGEHFWDVKIPLSTEADAAVRRRRRRVARTG
jgi:hypothetical protein